MAATSPFVVERCLRDNVPWHFADLARRLPASTVVLGADPPWVRCSGPSTLRATRRSRCGSSRAPARHPPRRRGGGADPDTAKPALTWNFDQQTIDAEATSDGWYALLTNLEASEADTAQVLLHYKGQEAVERRYSAFKGPLAIAAIYLKNNRRMTAMITVVCLALPIFSLIERQVRAALRAQGRTTITGLYAGRPARPPD